MNVRGAVPEEWTPPRRASAQGVAHRSPTARLGGRASVRPPLGHAVSRLSQALSVFAFGSLLKPDVYPELRAAFLAGAVTVRGLRGLCDRARPAARPRSPHPGSPLSHLHLCGGKMQHSHGACATLGRGGGRSYL